MQACLASQTQTIGANQIQSFYRKFQSQLESINLYNDLKTFEKT